jgi:hypothetical protein
LAVLILEALIGLPLGFLVMSAMLSAMLPTDFGRAMIVTLLTYVVSLFVFGAALVVVILAFGTASIFGR